MAGITEKVTPRREFVRHVGVGAMALAVGAVAAAGSRLDAQPIVDDTSSPDEPWLTHLTGKHRQFFDAVTTNDGWALLFAENFLNMNNQAYGLKDSEITAVVGLRHMSVPIALNDATWSRYQLGKFFNVMDKETKAPATRNVFANVHPGDMPFPGASVNELQARGVIFTACNVALTVLSGMTAQAAGLPADKAKAEWMAGLLPGVVVVPAGVLAVNRAQENRCTYCYGG